ncbi:MAG: hypothetical protein AAF560_17905 [Acidobacteriota bacterium]
MSEARIGESTQTVSSSTLEISTWFTVLTMDAGEYAAVDAIDSWSTWLVTC